MSIANVFKNVVITIAKQSSVYEAAKLMKEKKVGCLVVVEDENDDYSPIGIITDRDITIQIVANDSDPKDIRVSEIITDNLLVLEGHLSLKEAIQLMSKKGVRRAPVIDNDERITGIATADDLLFLLSQEMYSLGNLISKQANQIH